MDEYLEELTTTDMADRAGVTIRTVQRWISKGKLQVTQLPHGRYGVNPLDLVELSLPDRADVIPRERRLSYEELYDKFIEVRLELDDTQERLGQAERRIEQLARQVQQQSSNSGQRKAAKKGTRSKKKTSEWIPIGYVPVVDFARLHSIPISTVRSAITEGSIEVRHGSWKWGGRVISDMLDEEGCEQFLNLFEDHRSFHRCHLCPH